MNEASYDGKTAKEIIAVFDFDGTITTQDSMIPFIIFAKGYFRAMCGFVKLSPWFIRCLFKKMTRQQLKEKILKEFFRGYTIEMLNDEGKRFSGSYLLKKIMRPDALRRLAWHQTRKHRCILVSASIDSYLTFWGKEHGDTNYCNDGKESSSKGGLAALVDHHANFDGDDKIFFGFLEGIRQAKKTIDLCFSYIVMAPSMQKALLQAHKRGVRVRLLTNSEASNDYPLAAYAAGASLDSIVSYIEVYAMRYQTLHAKFCIFDDKMVSIGGHNVWPISHLHDCETNLFIYDEGLCREALATFESWLKKAELIDRSTLPRSDRIDVRFNAIVALGCWKKYPPLI